MCLIITIIMLGFSIQNLMAHNWLTGVVQLIIAIGFILLLLNNIRKTNAMRKGITCEKGCYLTDWITKIFKKKREN